MSCELSAFGLQRRNHGGQRWQQGVLPLLQRRYMHHRGEYVVGGLRAVHVIIGMQRRVLAALPARQFVAAIGDHLVEIHVGLRAAARLPDRQWKLLGVLPGKNLVAHLHDQCTASVVQRAQRKVAQRGSLLDQRERLDEARVEAVMADAEMLQGALCLRTPQRRGRHRDGTEGIVFQTCGPAIDSQGRVHGTLGILWSCCHDGDIR